MNGSGRRGEWFDEGFEDASGGAADEGVPRQSPAGLAADCGLCPLGFLREVSREAQPEMTLHLLAAARELLLAMETVVRAAEQTVQRTAGQSPDATPPRAASPEPHARVRRIDIA